MSGTGFVLTILTIVSGDDFERMDHLVVFVFHHVAVPDVSTSDIAEVSVDLTEVSDNTGYLPGIGDRDIVPRLMVRSRCGGFAGRVNQTGVSHDLRTRSHHCLSAGTTRTSPALSGYS